jgi:hypothetical protein
MIPISRNVLALLGVCLATTIGLGAGTAAADTTATDLGVNGKPRVRSSHAYIRAMIDEAAERSETFHKLVAAVEATNGIVYVEDGLCGHGVHACLTLHVTAAGNYRILRILIDRRQPDWDVMASIGHELQHAVEVLSNAYLTTTEAVFLFYSNGSNRDSFETEAAIKAGNAVRNQVGSYARRKLS